MLTWRMRPVADAARTPLAASRAEVVEPGASSAGPLPVGEDDDGLPGLRGFTDCEGIMSRSGSLPIEAFGAGSGRAFRCDERAEPPGEPSEGTVDSLAPAGSSMAGSDDKVRDEPAPAGTDGPVMIGTEPEPEPQLVHGADTVEAEGDV